MRVVDVTPISIGISTETPEKQKDVFRIIIPKNHPIPCEIICTNLSTSEDNQTTVLVQIYQGENKVASENEKLGEFSLAGIPPNPRQEEKLSVKMKIDKNGLLTVTATSVSTRQSTSLEVKSDRYLMEADTIERLAKEVSMHY